MIAEPRRLRLGILLSGGGRTLQNLIECRQRGELPVDFSVVIGSRPGLEGLARAERAGIPTLVVDPRQANGAAFDEAISQALHNANVDLVCMCGFLRFWTIPEDFVGRVINIHPALLPKHGGHGFYGLHVHRAVLASGDKESGCTVHFADNEYDHGPIILQRKVTVLPNDTPDTLAARVFEEEKFAYPEAIRIIAEGRVSLDRDLRSTQGLRKEATWRIRG